MTRETEHTIEGYAYLLAFFGCVPLANWMIGNVGTECIPNGPCLLPVGPGLMAPSGVLMIGVALVLRDLVQRRLGRGMALTAIVGGGVISAGIVPQELALASTMSFLLSELIDFTVYTPLQERGLVLAVLLSSMAGLVMDSILFLWMAFGNLDHLAGQLVGKSLMVLAVLPFIHWLRRDEIASERREEVRR
jgi:uncharacterized PurR-regulated membrane protein YhhQ (DUF165 family)